MEEVHANIKVTVLQGGGVVVDRKTATKPVRLIGYIRKFKVWGSKSPPYLQKDVGLLVCLNKINQNICYIRPPSTESHYLLHWTPPPESLLQWTSSLKSATAEPRTLPSPPPQTNLLHLATKLCNKKVPSGELCKKIENRTGGR